MKLHSKLSGIPDSYNPGQHLENKVESLVGDGPHFISVLLTKIANLDPMCRKHVTEIRKRLWPREFENRKKRAIKLLIEGFSSNSQRKKFMKEAGLWLDSYISRIPWSKIRTLFSDRTEGEDPELITPMWLPAAYQSSSGEKYTCSKPIREQKCDKLFCLFAFMCFSCLFYIFYFWFFLNINLIPRMWS